MNFALGVYPGVHGLIGAGLAANLPIGKPDSYPKLLRWLRELFRSARASAVLKRLNPEGALSY